MSLTALFNRRRSRGAATLEFALVAPLYLLLVLGIIEIALLMWVSMTMQFAVREGARYAAGGTEAAAALNGSQRMSGVVDAIRAQSMGLWDRVTPTLEVSINGAPAQPLALPYGPGALGEAGDLVTLRINCNWPLFSPFVGRFFDAGTYHFSVAADVRNEDGLP